jgi:hypothetical protein
VGERVEEVVRLATVSDAASIARIYYHRHGRLEGQWRDCVIVEKLLDDSEGG